MDAGYRGRAAPCQRERSDRALDRVTSVGTFHRGDVPDSHRPPPFGLLAEAVPQQPRAGNRPVSGARPALWTDNRETSGCVVETDCDRPPLFEQPLTRGNLIRPLVSCIRTSSDITDRRPRPLPAKLTGRRPLTSFARYFFFYRGASSAPRGQPTWTGALTCLLVATNALSGSCLTLNSSVRLRGVAHQKVAVVAAWGCAPAHAWGSTSP